MPLSSAEDLPRHFAECFAARDARAMAGILSEDGRALTLSGLWVEGRPALEAAWAAEFAGLFAEARLVTGRMELRMLGPGAAILHQRYIIAGAQHAAGEEIPRFTALLTAVVIARSDGWQAISLNFAPLSD